MQQQEFNKVFSGQEAKWAELNKQKDTPIMEHLKTGIKIPVAEILTVRREIEKHEVIIPAEKRAEIDEFIAQQRRFGLKERAIKRKVQVKFNITVI